MQWKLNSIYLLPAIFKIEPRTLYFIAQIYYKNISEFCVEQYGCLQLLPTKIIHRSRIKLHLNSVQIKTEMASKVSGCKEF